MDANQPAISGAGDGAEVVRVRDGGIPEAGVEQLLEQAGGLQGGVDVAVAGRAPFEVGGVRWPLDGGVRSSWRSLGSLFCRKSSGRSPDGQVLVLREQLEGVLAGAERVHEHERQTGAGGGAGGADLLDDDVQEGAAVPHGQQGLRTVQPHRGPEAAVEIDDDQLVERLLRLLGVDVDGIQRGGSRYGSMVSSGMDPVTPPSSS